MEITLTAPQTRFFRLKDKYPLFVGGFGSGKSLTMALRILDDLEYPNARIGAYAPTYDLLKLVTIPYVEELLTAADIPYKLNKGDYIMQVEGHGPIIFRSMDRPSRIVGYQTFRSHVDEIDTLRDDHAENAWNKIIARNRQKVYINSVPQLNRVSAYTTPEGFRFAYRRWVQKPAPGYVMVNAPTLSNPHLPEDYVQTLLDSYPPELARAYLNGIFTNLRSGNVYSSYDRILNRSAEVVAPGDVLHVGMDFNVMNGAAVVHVLRDGHPHAVDEIHKAFDTDQQIKVLKERYAEHHIVVYPDAAGKNRTAANTTETDLAKLRAAGFVIKVNHANPAIKDRVASMNAMFLNANGVRRYRVNDAACPRYADALEQQTWDNGLPDKSSGLDHPNDAAGYYIAKEFPIIRPKASVQVVQGGY